MRHDRLLRGSFLAFLLLLATGPLAGADRDALRDVFWTPTAAPTSPPNPALALRPAALARGAWSLDRGLLEAALIDAAGAPGATVTLPLPGGTLQRFVVIEDAILPPSLAARERGIRTYAGRGVDDVSAHVRLTLTPAGLHAFVASSTGDMYIDPVMPGDDQLHKAYRPRELEPASGSFSCGTETSPSAALSATALGSALPPAAITAGATLRTYRLAVSTTPEYTAWALGNSGSVLGEITQTVNEINLILQRDVGLRLVLAANINQLFYTASTTPYTSSSPPLQEIHDQITNVLGSANFDVGHLFHKQGPGGFGGRAVGSSVCKTLEKGKGRSGDATGTGPLFNTVVLHELGHQFSAGHTWVADNENPLEHSPISAWEPGRGVTIMSYGGRIFDDDAIPGAIYDLYYHGGTIEEIVTYTTTGAGNCPTPVASGNTPPTAAAGPDRTIPASTPFRLIGAGSDPDDPSANLTFGWEQVDACPYMADLAQLDDGVIPLFTSLPPSAGRVRLCPELAVLQAGTLFPGTTDPGMLGQQLPSTARTLTFRLTVRDNRPSGTVVTGGVDQDDVTLTVDAGSGPFRVTAPNGGEFWPADSVQVVTWDVAGTNLPPLGTGSVDILLSLDQGVTTSLLASGTPNDGSQAVAIPACTDSTACRVEVRAVGNIYFDMSDADFEIDDNVEPMVACIVPRSVLWPPRHGLMPVGLSFSVTDDCDPSPSRTISVYSTEADGPPPFAPDTMFLAPSSLRLRAERAYPGPGRIYVVVISATDAGGNRGVACCDVIVPGLPVASAIFSLKATAATAKAACLASSTDVAPPGFVPLIQGLPIP